MSQRIPPVPTEGAGGEPLRSLEEARRAAVQAVLLADAAEQKARGERRNANRLLRVYERKLMEYNGQLTLPEQ